MNQFRKVLLALAILCLVLVAGAAVFVYSGVYNVGADDPHTRPMFALMQTVRSRSIHARSKDISVPKLDDEQLILKGAGQYAAMCTGCHLKPGMTDSEIRSGLYPQPPNLSQVRVDPQDAFWVIKHGLKMSAMPAWGLTHDDDTIWSMVAFLQKLPDLTPEQYKDIVAKAPPDEDMDMGEEGGHHHHHHGDGQASEVADEGDSDTPGAAPESDDHDHEHAAAAEAPLSFDGLKPKAVLAAEAVAASFHTARQKGDREAVLALLAPEVRISEGGQTQSREEYASGHLGEDIAFLKSAQVKPVSVGSMAMGETAMVGTETQITMTDKKSPTTLRSRELLSLKLEGASWKIVAVRWQSAPAEDAPKD
jgi:mono/diheme cytochrome c family protein/ketosteroid isomerase-like protein